MSAAVEIPQVTAAFELRPGGIYVLELSEAVTSEAAEVISAQVALCGELLGVRFVLLDAVVKIKRADEVDA